MWEWTIQKFILLLFIILLIFVFLGVQLGWFAPQGSIERQGIVPIFSEESDKETIIEEFNPKTGEYEKTDKYNKYIKD